jgi:hypothetical protein
LPNYAIGYNTDMKFKKYIPNLAARLCIVCVFAWNMSCAISFIIDPSQGTVGYELSGVGAIAAIRGMGVIMLMWNISYIPLIYKPSRFRCMFVVVIIQQLIAVAGDMYVVLFDASSASMLYDSVTRFLMFDIAGIVLLIIAYFLSRKHD